MGHTPSKKFNFCLINPQSIFPKVLGIIKMFSGKTGKSFYVLFAQQWFSSWNFAMQTIFVQSLSYGGVMNTDLIVCVKQIQPFSSKHIKQVLNVFP